MSRDGASVVDMSRGSVPVVGVVLVTFLAVVLAVAVGAVMTTTTPERPPTAQLGLSADASGQEIVLTHEGGETLTISNLELRIEVDGKDLAQQPRVPFFASDGFRGGPEGPFNNASDDEWHAGETATLRIASTNAPAIEPDSTVTVVVVTDGAVIFAETVRAA